MAKAIVPVTGQTNFIVKKSNALMRCRWKINSVYEPRILAVLAARIQTNDKDFKNYKIPVTEILGDDYGGDHLRELEKAVLNLLHCVIQIFDADGKGWSAYTLLCKGRYIHKKGVLEVQFHPDMKPHYLNMKARFAQYSLDEFMALSGVYSQRLYEVLKSWSDRPEVTIPLDELHEYLNTPKSYRKDFQNFKNNVLDRAYKDIVQRPGSTLRYEYEAIKAPGRGGKITALRFWFQKVTAARGARAKADSPKPSPTQSAKDLERELLKECQDCLRSHAGHCDNYDKEPSEITGRSPKKKLCRFCLTNGEVAVQKTMKGQIERGELAFLGIHPEPKSKPKEKQSAAG